MRIGFVSDLHLGNHRKLGGPIRCSLNERCWNALKVFQRTVERAREKECHALFVLGDFFDTARPLPQLYHEAMLIAEDAGITIYFMRGNHETVSAAKADNSLAPLLHLDPGGLARDSVIEQPRVVKVGRNIAVICVPYIADLAQDLELASWDALFEEASKVGRRILALHVGITDQSTEKFLQRKPGTIGVSALADLCAEHEIGCVVAGHFHQHRLWRQEQDHSMTSVMQLGALCPRDFRDLGLDGYGTLAIWDNGKLRREEIHGPRFFDYSPGEGPREEIDFGTWIDLLRATSTTGNWLYPRIKVPAAELPKYREALLELKHKHSIADFDLSPTAASEQAAKQAAEAGQSQQSLDCALETCTRSLRRATAEKVQRLARKYLEKSKKTHAGCVSLDVSHIGLGHLTRHTDTVLELPPEGVVVVQGPNDSGKSSLTEATPAACWGKTIRKFPPWQSGKLSTVDITLSDGTWISRSWDRKPGWQKRKPEDHKLDFGNDDESNRATNQPASNTVAQAQLESLIGTFELWQRSHVLSSIDALRFSLATDGERKRLAEQVVGLDFDTALKACRADIKAAEKEKAAEKRTRDLAQLSLSGEQRRKEAAQDAIHRMSQRGAQPKVTERQLRQRRKEHEEALKGIRAKQRKVAAAQKAAREESQELASKIGKVRAAQALQKKQFALLDDASCPTCGQEIDETLREELTGEAAEHGCRAREQLAAYQRTQDELAAEREELGDESARLLRGERELRRKLDDESSTAKLATDEARRQAEIADAAITQIRRYICELDNHEDEIALLDRRLQVLKETEKILGLKGARALVLADVFTSVGEAASHALSQMSANITLEISASKVVVNGKDYRASGHGVRKKVDFALAVALAEVTAAASGRKPGTLWLDEIDDGLDGAEGVAQVAQLIQELAHDRCVVVITHNDRLAEELEAAEQWDVCDGKVEVRDG